MARSGSLAVYVSPLQECYIWQNKTYGIHSTQRAEAIHSVIQRFCSKHSSIVDLVLDIDRMASNQQSKSETDLLRHQLNEKIGPAVNILPITGILLIRSIARGLADKLSEYAARILRSQAVQISQSTNKKTAESGTLTARAYIW